MLDTLGPATLEAELVRFTNILNGETDRGCALVGGEMLSEGLRSLLQGYFVDTKHAEKLLDGPMAPLQAFASRADMAYAIALIDKDCLDDIKTIRDVRNSVAHFDRKKGLGFESDFKTEVNRDRILKMKTIPAEFLAFAAGDARKAFIYWIGMINGALYGIARALNEARGDLEKVRSVVVTPDVVSEHLRHSLKIAAKWLVIHPNLPPGFIPRPMLDDREGEDE
jgi:hypothetical protein